MSHNIIRKVKYKKKNLHLKIHTQVLIECSVWITLPITSLVLSNANCKTDDLFALLCNAYYFPLLYLI